jgi:hypothetical protein
VILRQFKFQNGWLFFCPGGSWTSCLPSHLPVKMDTVAISSSLPAVP